MAQFPPLSILPTAPLPAPTLARLRRQLRGVGWTGAGRHMQLCALAFRANSAWSFPTSETLGIWMARKGCP